MKPDKEHSLLPFVFTERIVLLMHT